MEHRLAAAVASGPGGAPVGFVVWSARHGRFRPVAPALLAPDMLRGLTLAEAADEGWPATPPERVCPPGPGAAFLIAGKAWMTDAAYAQAAVALANHLGTGLCPFVHDLIPARLPYLYEETFVASFQAGLDLLLDSAETVLCNSEQTRRDLEAYCYRRVVTPPRAAVVRLGDEVEEEPSVVPSDQEEALVAELARRGFALGVGAVHRRKNYELLHAAWHLLAEAMGPRTPLLVVAGGALGEGGRATRRALEEDPVVGRFVRVLDRVDDALLAGLYRSCLLTVYPSLYEGWGLPVCEALRRGKVCLAADTSSIPEIFDLGGDLLSPHDPRAWANRIQFYANSGLARERREAEIRARYRPTGWAETAAAVRRAVEADPEERPSPCRYRPGEWIDLGDPRSARWLGDGWSPAGEGEGAGRGLSAEGGELCLAVADEAALAEDLVLEVACPVAPEPGGGGTLLQVALDGRAAGRLSVEAGAVRAAVVAPERPRLPGLMRLRLQPLPQGRNGGGPPPDEPRVRLERMRLVPLGLHAAERWLEEQGRPAIEVWRGPDPEGGITLRAGQAREDGPGVASEAGVLAFDIAALPRRSGGTAVVLCRVAAKAGPDWPARLYALLDGTPVATLELHDARERVIAVPVRPEHRCSPLALQLLVVHADRDRPVPLSLRELGLPRRDWLPAAGAPPTAPAVEVGRYLLLGRESQDGPAPAMLHFGWNTAPSFGVETLGGTALVFLRPHAAPAGQDARALKLRYKIRARGDEGAVAIACRFDVLCDGSPIGALAGGGDEVRDVTLTLPPAPARCSFPLSIEFRASVPEGVADPVGWMPPILVLRGLQLLPAPREGSPRGDGR